MLKDGANRDESRETRQVGVAETGYGRRDHSARSCPQDGGDRPLGAQAAPADEQAWRCGRGTWVAGPGIEPEDREPDTETGHRSSEAGRVARLRTNLCQRAVSQATSDPGRQRDAARMDDRSRIVEARRAPNRGGPLLAAAAQRVWRTGAVGHIRARLAGRTRAGALPGAADRRRDQLELGPVCEARRDAVQHGRAVGGS